MILCGVPGCVRMALVLHDDGQCGAAACAEHAYPGTTCPSCQQPYAMADVA